MKNKESTVKKYIDIRPTYKKLGEKAVDIIKEVLDEHEIKFHAISTRAKTTESFSKKIDNPKYDDPLNQLTDLAGVRIIGYVEDDVAEICNHIEDIFDIDKSNSLDKSDDLGIDKVGYKSIHYICNLPTQRCDLPEYKKFVGLKFEIQIRTILQHSWAEIEHDKDYKFSGELPKEIKRRFKLIAGMLEVADREFNRLSQEIDDYSANVAKQVEKSELNIPLDSTSLITFMKEKFKKSIEINLMAPTLNGSDNKIIKELKQFGIDDIQKLDTIILEGFENKIIQHHFETSFLGTLRDIMLVNDFDKYFDKSWNYHWSAIEIDAIEFLSHFDITKEMFPNSIYREH